MNLFLNLFYPLFWVHITHFNHNWIIYFQTVLFTLINDFIDKLISIIIIKLIVNHYPRFKMLWFKNLRINIESIFSLWIIIDINYSITNFNLWFSKYKTIKFFSLLHLNSIFLSLLIDLFHQRFIFVVSFLRWKFCMLGISLHEKRVCSEIVRNSGHFYQFWNEIKFISNFWVTNQ